MVFLMHRLDHRIALAKWLLHADTIGGMNLPFDLTYLRADPLFHSILDGRHTLLDVSHLNFSHSDARPERSLKDIGPILGSYIYAQGNSLKDGFRYESPLDPAIHDYNAQDTFNSMLGIATLASLIERDYPGVPKLTPETIAYWSDSFYLAIRMIEAGTPMSPSRLRASLAACTAATEEADAMCRSHGLILFEKTKADKGRVVSSKQSLLTHALEAVDSLEGDTEVPHASAGTQYETPDGELHTHPATVRLSKVQEVLGVDSIYQCPTLELTKKKREVSASEVNRKLIAALLPPDHPLQPALLAWKRYATAQGNISKYLLPLLSRRRAKQNKNPLSSILLPQPGAHNKLLREATLYATDVQLTYSKWYILPSNFKDSSGGGQGGQQQARPASTDPNVQQFPPLIVSSFQSRFVGGSILKPDLSQIELRTAALLSGDESLCLNYAQGRDLHTDRAVFIAGPDIVNHPHFKSGDRENDPRQWYKTFNFEDLYLAGWLVMQQKLLKDSGKLFPRDLFEQVIASRRLLRPGLCDWQDQMVALAARQTYLSLPITGHSRSFMGGFDEAPEIVNFPIQATAAITQCEILRYCHARLPRLSHPNPPIVFFINWYDAAYFDCAPSHIPFMRSLYADAVAHVSTHGYWARLCDHHHRTVPLKYEMHELS